MAKSASHHGRYDAIKDRRSTPTVDDISLQKEPYQVHTYTDLQSHGSQGQVFQRVSLDNLPSSTTHVRDESVIHREGRYSMEISHSLSRGSDEGYIPSPPPRPPSANRSMIRVRSARQRPTSSRSSQESEDFPNVTIMRPPSSFNKFHPLPSIESQSPERHDPVNSSTQNLPLSPRSKCDTGADNDTRHDTNNNNKHSRRHTQSDVHQRHETNKDNKLHDRHLAQSDVDPTHDTNKDGKHAHRHTQSDFDPTHDTNKDGKHAHRHTQSDIDPRHATNKDSKHAHRHTQSDIDPRHDTNKERESDIRSNPLPSESVFKKPFSRSSLCSPPPEPSEDEDRLLLAVKLPTDGSRHQRYFSTEDRLQDVLHFAESVNQEALSQYVLASNAPRTVFSDLAQRLCDVDIHDKTMLYFEKK